MISLITPVRNSASTIGDCLRSVAGQSLACQHILVDGASTDGTLAVIDHYRGTDTMVISEPDRGMYDAINKGLSQAGGDIVGVLNADDYYPSDDVLQQVNDVFADPAVDVTYGDLLYVDRDDTSRVVRRWKSGPYQPDRFYAGWMPPHPTFFIRRALYQRHGGYRLDLGSAADYELMLRMLLKHHANAAYIPRVLVHMRNAGISNASLGNRLRANRFDRHAWRVNGLKPRPWTLLAKPLGKLGQWLTPG